MKHQTTKKTCAPRRKSGQAMVEYIIIVVIVAIAAIAVFGVFSDRIREMLGGATEELGGAGDPNSDTSEEYLQDLGN
jgi:Flp pilus assembly pilin Flp